MDDRCLIPGMAKNFFFSPPRPDWLWDQPLVLHNGSGGCLHWIMWLEREAKNSHPSNSKVKDVWNIFSAPINKSS
jgi:hypothetical protein